VISASAYFHADFYDPLKCGNFRSRFAWSCFNCSALPSTTMSKILRRAEDGVVVVIESAVVVLHVKRVRRGRAAEELDADAELRRLVAEKADLFDFVRPAFSASRSSAFAGTARRG